MKWYVIKSYKGMTQGCTICNTKADALSMAKAGNDMLTSDEKKSGVIYRVEGRR